MIDLHTHFLPGIDDGARNLNEALALARAAVADGITVCAMTPHIHPRRYPNLKSALLGHLDAFRTALAEHQIPLQIYLGAEVRLSIESLGQLLEGEVPFLGEVGGYKIMLLEFPHQMIPVGSQQFVNKLLAMKIRPLIAHPERNKAVLADLERIRPFVDAGCWLQVTAGALTGHFGAPARKVALRLIENDWVHVVASDSHNLEARPPVISAARDVLAQLFGPRTAQQMVAVRPAQILGIDAA